MLQVWWAGGWGTFAGAYSIYNELAAAFTDADAAVACRMLGELTS